MKKIYIICLSIITMGCLNSCLEWGLEELDTYSDTKVTTINFEYRWMVPENPNDPWAGEKLQVKTLLTQATISDGKIKCVITVPPASGTFTEEVRNNVTLQNIIAYVTISSGATILPNGNSPVLGQRGDFSQPNLSYKVIAADKKNEQNWELIIENFNK